MILKPARVTVVNHPRLARQISKPTHSKHHHPNCPNCPSPSLGNTSTPSLAGRVLLSISYSSV
ncbi:unnamed protein product [Chondrus crispus]|uniref:Uncharacterized protein n=1 Tax=Chondrus crispus TaxID=2769 RepID=R7Q5P9_CHOCR|nr:unnamed protein product [Chondrus crispus]CDF33857.1 unnamed protein product [Chondrus crispus]|eukprot:XP_005713676.1 unnamed protein product [Chondrus crispus]